MKASSGQVILFVAGEQSRIEASVALARRIYRDRPLMFVCETRQRSWLSEVSSENIFAVEPPFNPYGRDADKIRQVLISHPIEVCAIVIGSFGFESIRFRLFALRLRPSRFNLLSAAESEPVTQMNRCSFARSTGIVSMFKIFSFVAGWLSPLDQPLAVGLAWLARALTIIRYWREVSRGKEIVHVLPTIGTGGVQKQLVLFLKNRSSVYKHRVVVMWSADRFFASELDSCGVPVYYLDAAGIRDAALEPAALKGRLLNVRPLLFLFRSAFPFCWEIMKLTFILRTLKPRPDIVHCWLLMANLAGSIAARLAGARRVVSSVRNIHSEVELNYYDPRWQRVLERASVPLIDVITANANAVATDYHTFTGAPFEKIVTVPNGVDIGAFRILGPQERNEKRRSLNLAFNDIVVGTVARLAREKDFETFFRALALARAKLPTLHCIIAGDGPLQAHLESFCASLNLTASVQFLGERKDVGDLIQCYDVFLLSSFIEGMPNVVMESQLLGTPVVATRAGGTVDLIRHEETGLLAPVGDPAAIASCIERILTDQNLRDSICRAASEQIRKNFTVEQLVERTEKIYGLLLQNNAGVSMNSCVE